MTSALYLAEHLAEVTVRAARLNHGSRKGLGPPRPSTIARALGKRMRPTVRPHFPDHTYPTKPPAPRGG